jgi:hypothetical protein
MIEYDGYILQNPASSPYSCQMLNLRLRDRFSKNNLLSNFMKIRPVGAELFHADGRTDE